MEKDAGLPMSTAQAIPGPHETLTSLTQPVVTEHQTLPGHLGPSPKPHSGEGSVTSRMIWIERW